MKITDGTGSGREAEVDSENRLKTFSITEVEDKHINRDGKQWSLYFTVTPTGAGDYFFYLKNTGSNELAISDVRIMCDSVDTINYHFVSGTQSGGTTLDITNRNSASSKIPSATIETGANITGLSSEGIVFFERIDAANKRFKLSTSSNIIIGRGGAVGLEAVTGTGLITCVVSLTDLSS